MEKNLTIWETIGKFFETYCLTLVAAIVACVCVGCLVEIFKQSLFTKMEEKYKDNPDKLTKIKTIKAACSFALAAVLTAFFLACIWKSKLPNIGDYAVLPIWFTAMYLLQMLVDLKAVKNIISRILGNFIKSTEPKEPKKKMKKKVTWVEVDE